jgi:ATP-binding cassette subfamily B protein
MKSLLKMFPFAKPYRVQAILALLLLVGMVASDLLIPRLTQRIIDEGIAAQSMAVIITTSLTMLAVAVVSALFAIGNTLLAVRVGQGMGADLRSAMVRKVQTFSFGNLDHLQTGQLLVRSTSDVNQVQAIFQMGLRILTRAPLWMLGSMVMLVLTSPQLALLMLALMPVILALIVLSMAVAQPLYAQVQAKLDVLNQVLEENLAGIRVVKAFVRAAHEKARFSHTNDELTEGTVKIMRFTALLIPTMQFIVNLSVVGVIWFGGISVIGGDLSLGQMMASINYISYSLFPMLMLGGMIGPLSAANASAERIQEVLQSRPEVEDHPQAECPREVRGRIVFEGVSFSYNGHDYGDVLRNIDLVAEPGETVALLGATGSGKSSLVNLIPRFYDADEGRITLDGVDVRELPLGEVRTQMGVAVQEAVLFTGTVRDNIRYGRPDATEEQVIAAAKAAQAHDFITSLPDGYDAMVGQRGVNLSGGQKQRISIARALLVNPRVLILDDSTSAVDVETEARIQDALEERMGDRTRFVIAQRVSTVLHADKIVVLDEGEIAATGTHSELMASSPIYREIYQSQLAPAQGDRDDTPAFAEMRDPGQQNHPKEVPGNGGANYG